MLRERYTFDSFVPTDGAKDALALASQIPQHDRVSRESFVFYGPEGSGKTHLLYAIGNQLRAQGWRVQRYYAEYLVNLVQSPAAAQRIDLNISQPASCEVLILDEVDWLLKRLEAKDRVSNLLQELVKSPAKLIVSSAESMDRFLAEERPDLKSQQARLCIAGPADRSTLLRAFGRRQNIHFSVQALDLLSERLPSNAAFISSVILRLRRASTNIPIQVDTPEAKDLLKSIG